MRPVPADCEEVVAHHVHHAYTRNGHLEEVGTHVGHGSYEQASVAATLDGEEVFFGPALFDHVFRCRDEVVEDIDLLCLGARFVPFLAIFAASAEVCLRIDASVLKPEKPVGGESGIEGDVETAVAIQIDGVFAVALQSLLIGDEHRDLCAVG